MTESVLRAFPARDYHRFALVREDAVALDAPLSLYGRLAAAPLRFHLASLPDEHGRALSRIFSGELR